MSEKPEHLLPVGERYVRKAPCRICNSKGYRLSQTQETCTKCIGAGWIEGHGSAPVVCPVCKGYKSVAKEARIKCEKCNGLGYTACLMQQFRKLVLCDYCNGYGVTRCHPCRGSGYLECESKADGDGNHFCPTCYGKDKVISSIPTNLSLKQWIATDAAKDAARIFGDDYLENLGQRESLILSDRRVIRVSYCSKCYGRTSESKCSLCNDVKIIWVHFYDFINCLTCGGSGLVKAPCKCGICSGTGKIPCSQCDGAKTMTQIVSRKV